MASTNFKNYMWLIDTLIGAGEQGLTLRQINDQYQLDIKEENLDRLRNGLPPVKERFTRHFEPISGKTFINWRAQIFRLFGIEINTPVYDNRYVVMNPEIWEKMQTLKEIVKILTEEEERGYKYTPLPYKKRGRKSKSTSMLTNLMCGLGEVEYDVSQFDFNNQSIPEMVDVVRFSMAIGESLIINYGKTRNQRGKILERHPYIFEPQQLKKINERWYVGGFIYPYGRRDLCTKTIYDAEQIRLYDNTGEDFVAPRYELSEEFDIYSIIPKNWEQTFDATKVVAMYLRVAWNIFEKHPFCQAQEKIKGGKAGLSDKYKIFTLPNADFLLQYFAYGDEVTVFTPRNKDVETGLEISKEQVAWLQHAKNEILPFNEKRIIVKRPPSAMREHKIENL